MDLERKLELIMRLPTEEVIEETELRNLLEAEEHPIAYGGWEPSGYVHLGTGLICAYKMKDFIEAGVRFKAYLACFHAYINMKLGGDLALITKAAKHFIHSWKALGVPEGKVEFVWPSDLYDNLDYWTKVLRVGKELTLARTVRTLEIMGRKEGDARHVADFMYTPMQVADIFQMECDICQLGIDQRKANVVAREIGERLGFWKPICVHHHLLQGLEKPPTWPLPTDAQLRREALASVKMSKSQPDTAIWIYDPPAEITRKVRKAFCPEREVQFNPIIDIARHIIFREKSTMEIKRDEKYGGVVEFQSCAELERAYTGGKLHPGDLKTAVAESLVEILEPVRDYFAKNKEAKEGLEAIRSGQITR